MHKKKLASLKRRLISNAKAKVSKSVACQTVPRLACLLPPYGLFKHHKNDGLDSKRFFSFMLKAEALRKYHEKTAAPEARSRNFLRDVAEAAAWLVMEAVTGI